MHVNRYPWMADVTDKGALFRTLNLYRRVWPHLYGFYPRTWVLPDQLADLSNLVVQARKDGTTGEWTFPSLHPTTSVRS